MLKSGVNPNVRDKKNFAPLHYAAQYGHTNAITTLLDAGADPNAKTEDGLTALDLIKNDSPIHGTDAYWQLKEATTR